MHTPLQTSGVRSFRVNSGVELVRGWNGADVPLSGCLAWPGVLSILVLRRYPLFYLFLNDADETMPG